MKACHSCEACSRRVGLAARARHPILRLDAPRAAAAACSSYARALPLGSSSSSSAERGTKRSSSSTAASASHKPYRARSTAARARAVGARASAAAAGGAPRSPRPRARGGPQRRPPRGPQLARARRCAPRRVRCARGGSARRERSGPTRKRERTGRARAPPLPSTSDLTHAPSAWPSATVRSALLLLELSAERAGRGRACLL
jgi:hypothetical protein